MLPTAVKSTNFPQPPFPLRRLFVRPALHQHIASDLRADRTSSHASAMAASDHYPIELRYIRALFLEAQYRQCIQACKHFIKLSRANTDERDPISDTFIHFYLGLCHDEIARLMHHNSAAKLPSFAIAQQSYQDAIDALPTQKEALALCQLRVGNLDNVPGLDGDDETTSNWPLSPAVSAYTPCDLDMFSSSPPFGSPPPLRGSKFSNLSEATTSSWPLSSDQDDLESHNSYSELMTPNRLTHNFSRKLSSENLPRDRSSMSLLEMSPSKTPRQASMISQPKSGLPREFSRISLHEQCPPMANQPALRRLIRPVRLGSPPQPHGPPQNLPRSVTNLNDKSKLPKPTLRTKSMPTLPETRNDSCQTSPEPVSPLSNDGSTRTWSEVSSMSQYSLQTPTTQKNRSCRASRQEQQILQEQTYLRLADHTAAMRAQLQRHIILVEDAKERLHRFQEQKRSLRRVPSTGTPLSTIKDGQNFSSPPIAVTTPVAPVGLPKAKSYWSFIPPDVKVEEKKRRIAAGREREWARARFQPERYQKLCEKALEEL